MSHDVITGPATRRTGLGAGSYDRAASAKPRGGFLVTFCLRYGVLALATAVLVGGQVAVMLIRGAPWRGDVVWTLDWLAIGHVLVGPAVAGFAAVDVARLTRGSTHLRTTPWRSPVVGVALGHTLVLAAAHVLVVVGVLAVSAPPRIDPFAWLAVLVQVAILAFFVAIGALVGRFAGPVLGGVVAAVTALLSIYLAASPSDHVTPLYAGAATVPRLGYAYDPGYLLTQLGMLAALTVAMLAVRPVAQDEGRRRPRGRGLLVAASALVAVTAVAWTAPADRLAAIPAAPDHCGAVITVPVCFHPEHRRIADAFSDELWALFDAANREGYDALIPARVVEASQTDWPADAEVGAVYVGPENLAGEPPTTWHVAQDLVQPLHCPALSQEEPPREQYWTDLHALTATWVMLVDPLLGEENGYFDEPLAAEEAVRLVDEFRTCTYPFT